MPEEIPNRPGFNSRLIVTVVLIILVLGSALMIWLRLGQESGTGTPNVNSPGVASADPTRLKSQAEQGDATAQNALGELLLRGEGVRQDVKSAAEWLRKSAEQGFAAGQFNYGSLFEAGQGVPLDYTRAIEWYRKAAEQGHAGAQYSLAAMYVYARGVEKNDAEALKWLSRAAQQGDAMAEYAMGQRFKTGTGVTLDLVEAFKWFTLAAAQQIPDATAALNEIKVKMSREQIKEGEKRAAAFAQQASRGAGTK